MTATTMNIAMLTHMPANRATRFSPMTMLAVMLTVTGLVISVLDSRWALQLVSLGCVYSGALLACLALLIHLLRGNLAWAADSGVLLTLSVLIFSSPMLPASMQDYLEYLLP